jgi:DNA replication and repair protein RecF
LSHDASPIGAVAAPPETIRRVHLELLRIHDLRNLTEIALEPSPSVNVISGHNGHGKTSVLEAIYLLATSRSFRTPRLGELLRHGAEVTSVRGRFVEQWDTGPLAREQSVGLSGGRRTCRIDGSAPRSVAHYATRSPVVVFDPQQMALSTGPASERRTLLDRVTLFTQPDGAAHRARYGRALRERQRLLGDRFPRLDDQPELDAYERLLADHGAAITRARSSTCEQLVVRLSAAFARIAAPDLELEARYAPGGSLDPEQAAAALRERRRVDAQRKRTGFGPHLDDLAILLDGHPARVVGSQGQHRALTLALKSAELACIAEARGLLPILLLDDVSSELDPDRTSALFDFLSTTESQIFLTTTRADLIVASGGPRGERRDFEVRRGGLQSA